MTLDVTEQKRAVAIFKESEQRFRLMNAVAVFVGVLTFGRLWGVWGLLLGVPVLAAIKAVSDRVDDFKAISELLGD